MNRENVTSYIATQKHLRKDLTGAKRLAQIAEEVGTTRSTIRRWLRRDHWELWMEHWASAQEIWDAELAGQGRSRDILVRSPPTAFEPFTKELTPRAGSNFSRLLPR